MSSKGPIDPQSAVDFLIKMAPIHAKAKAERVYLQEFRKSKKAILMQQSAEKSAAMQERDAYADPKYQGLLAAIRVAVEAEEKAWWMMTAAQIRVDVWRSQNASNRNIERVTA